MSIASAQLKYCFGLKGEVKQNVSFLDEQTIVYPAGSNLVLLNIDQKTQKFLSFSQGGDGGTAMCVSSNRRYVAIAEKHPDKPTVTIFDVQTLRRRKVLTCNEMTTANEYVSLAFSPDSKYLIGQSGGPDWMLVYWQWEKAKLLASTKVTGQQNSNVCQISFNPKDNTQVCVIGEKLFKLFRYNEGSLKQFAFTKVEPLNYLSHSWLTEDRLLLGTDSGKIQLFEVADLRNEFYVNQSNTKPSSKTSLGPSDCNPVHAILPYSKGFVCSSGPGTIWLFEKSEDKNSYKCIRPVSIWFDPANHDEEQELNYDDIVSLTFSPSEENVVCSTRSQQLYSLTLSAADLGKGAAFDFLSSSFHCGSITGMGLCLRKPIIATCSLDKSIRVWNYESNSLDLAKQFQEEAYSISVHPSGLFLLVGFSEKLRLMNVLIDDIRPFKEFMIRGCRECSFSNGGHLFAAANANLVQLYSTFSFENTVNLKGHNGKVRSIAWSPDDSRLVSCSMDGAVYEWNVLTGKREKECVLKNCSYTSIALSPDMRSTYAVGSDRSLKEIVLADSQILRQISGGEVVLTQVVMSHSGKMLFVGTSSGAIRSVKFPLAEPGEWQEHLVHSSSVTKMSISYDDQFLFTVGDDGILFIFKVMDKESRMLKRERESGFAEEVLITRSDLEEKNTTMSELRTRVEELKMENDYQLRLKDMNYNEKIKDLSDKFIQEIESLKAKNETLSVDKERQDAKYKEEIQLTVESHSTELQERENTTSAKLMGEYEKYQELQARSQRLQEDYERQLQNMEEAKETALQELTEHYERKRKEMEMKLEEAGDQYRQLQKESEELHNQMEEDTDEEILSLKNRYERQLRQQSDENLKLRGDTGILRKKVDSLQGEITGLKSDITLLNQEVKKRDGVIESLRNDIASLKKEIQERDDTIRDKEQRILDMKKKNQELEKFKFVLDYKIKELRRQMEPRENEIKSAKEQISKMEVELGDYSRENKDLLRQLEHQELKLKATTKEMMKEQQLVHDLKVQIDGIKCGLHGTTQHIQEPKELKLAMMSLYKKYLQDYDNTSNSDTGGEADIHVEYSRQRHHMEKTVASLRKKLQKDTDIHRMEKIRVMQENVSLLKEINDLRRELKLSRTQAHDFEAALKIARKSGFNDRAVLATIKASPPPTELGKVEPNDDTRVLEIQRKEISKLRTKIRELEGMQLSNKLPPLLSIPQIQ